LAYLTGSSVITVLFDLLTLKGVGLDRSLRISSIPYK